MNKIIKYCVAGEGTMLGLLAKYDLKRSDRGAERVSRGWRNKYY